VNFFRLENPLDCGFAALAARLQGVRFSPRDTGNGLTKERLRRGAHREKICTGTGVGCRRIELGWLLCWQGQGPSSGDHQGIGLRLRAPFIREHRDGPRPTLVLLRKALALNLVGDAPQPATQMGPMQRKSARDEKFI
jgi:hypothetical protein